MKNKFAISILSIVLLLCIPNTANAQFGKLLKKAKKKVEKTIESDRTKKTTKPTKTKESPTPTPTPTQKKEEAPVQQKTKVITQAKENPKKPKENVVEKDGENQDSKTDLHHEYVQTVRLFLYGLDDFIKGRRPPEPLRKYSRTYANPPYELKDAIHVVNDDDFVEKKLLKELVEKAKNPNYIEERYRTIDYVYKAETDYREKYPTNTDPTQGEYGRTKEVYNAYKIIQQHIVKNNPDFDAQVVYAKKKMDKINKKFEARLNAIAINKVHKANLNKIIFTSNSRINPKTAPASAYKTTFKPGEEIFAVAMVDKPLNRNIVKKAYAQVEMKSGVNIIETVVEHQMFPVKPNQKYFVFPIVVKSSKFKCSRTEATANTEYGMRWLSNKEDRRFQIQIWLKEAKQFHNSSGLLKGTFTYDASEGDGTILRKMANQVAAKCGRK